MIEGRCKNNTRLKTVDKRGRFKYTTLGLESYTVKPLPRKFLSSNSILLRNSHPGLGWPQHRNNFFFTPVCFFSVVYTFSCLLCGVLLRPSSTDGRSVSLESSLVGTAVEPEPVGRESWHSFISRQLRSVGYREGISSRSFDSFKVFSYCILNIKPI